MYDNVILLKVKITNFVILCEISPWMTSAIPAFFTVEDSADAAEIEELRGFELEIWRFSRLALSSKYRL